MVRLKIILLVAFLSSVAESRYGFRRLPMKVIEQELFTFSNTTHKSRFTVFVLGTKYGAGSYPEALSYCTRKHRALPNATTTWNSVEFQKAADNKGIIGYAIACPKSGNTYCTTKNGYFSASSITRHQIVCMAIEKVTCNDNPCSPGYRCVDQPNAFQAYICPKVQCKDNPCPQEHGCVDHPQQTPAFKCYNKYVKCKDNPCPQTDQCRDQRELTPSFKCYNKLLTCHDNPCPQDHRCIFLHHLTPPFKCYYKYQTCRNSHACNDKERCVIQLQVIPRFKCYDKFNVSGQLVEGPRIDESTIPQTLSVPDEDFSPPLKTVLYRSLLYGYKPQKLYEPKVWPLKEFDIFLSTVRKPDYRARAAPSPNGYCNIGSGFWGGSKKIFDEDSNFFHSFLSSDVHKNVIFTNTFWRSGAVSREGKVIFQFWDGTKFDKGRYPWDHSGHLFRLGSFVPWGAYVCVAVTFKDEEKECGGKSYLSQRWSISGGHFQPARDLCRLVMGFDFPTPNALALLMLYDNQCQSLRNTFQNAWVQSDARHPVGVKRFICMGCHVHFMNTDGMKHVDSNGKVTCKSGYILITKKNTTHPTCLKDQVTGVWYWDIDTIGLCKLVVVTQNNMIYYHPIYERDLKSGFQSKTCPSGYAKLIFNSPHDPISHLLSRIITSWGSGMSAIHAHGNDIYAYNSIGNNFTMNQIGKNVKNIGHICKVQCTFYRTIGMKNVSRTDGLVTCHPGYLWSCPYPPCAREGQPRPLPICNGTNNGWRNVATCIPILNTKVLTQLLNVNQNLSIDPSTATVSCKGDTYETCVGKTKPCAGGPTNIAITNDGVHLTNLPSCATFRVTKGKFAHYRRSAGNETLEMAKWACNQVGAYLMSEIHYSLVEDTKFDFQTLWLETSNGQWYQFLPDPKRLSHLDYYRSDFICVTYRADINHKNLGTPIDFSRQPEICRLGTMTTGKSGREKCG